MVVSDFLMTPLRGLSTTVCYDARTPASDRTLLTLFFALGNVHECFLVHALGAAFDNAATILAALANLESAHEVPATGHLHECLNSQGRNCCYRARDVPKIWRISASVSEATMTPMVSRSGQYNVQYE